MIAEFDRKLALRRAKEEGNYYCFSKLLRYGGKRYTENTNLAYLYKLLKKVDNESNCYMYYNGNFEYAANIFKKLDIVFN